MKEIIGIIIALCGLGIMWYGLSGHSVIITDHDDEPVIKCVSAYSVPNEIQFYKSNVTKIVMDESISGQPFINYYIVDTRGKTHSINSNELDNFSCEQLNISK